jgi:RNA polymerase sigma-70 factor (ECF subfamily)
MQPDRDLARRMLAGDESAFDEFFRETFPRLYRFALTRMNHDEGAAEEVVQAALCAAVTRLRTYRGEASLFTWLCTFCRHEISAYYERQRREAPVLALMEHDAEVEGALESLWAQSGAGQEDRLVRRDLSRLVHTTLDRLPDHYADALEWKYVDSLSVKEIAARFGLSAKATESLLTRARTAFRDGFRALMQRRFA